MKFSFLFALATSMSSLTKEYISGGLSIILSLAIIVTIVLLYISLSNVYKIKKRRKEFEEL